MQTIYLQRHGEYDNPLNIAPFHYPVELSKLGIAHTKRAAQYYIDKDIKKLISSPILRTTQTAQIINAKLDLKIDIDPRAAEVKSPFEGTNYNEFKKEIKGHRLYSCPRHQQGGGESISNVKVRMLEMIKEVIKYGSNTIIVSHGDPIVILALAILGYKDIVEDLVNEKGPIGYLKRGDAYKLTSKDNFEKDINLEELKF